MVEVPIPVSKIGASWVLKLKKETRQMLNITEEGEVLVVRKGEIDKNGSSEASGPENYDSE